MYHLLQCSTDVLRTISDYDRDMGSRALARARMGLRDSVCRLLVKILASQLARPKDRGFEPFLQTVESFRARILTEGLQTHTYMHTDQRGKCSSLSSN